MIEIFSFLDVHSCPFTAAEIDWKSTNINNKLSKQALAGGTDADGSTIYVGRATFNDVTMPAKIIPDRQRAYVCKFFNLKIKIIEL